MGDTAQEAVWAALEVLGELLPLTDEVVTTSIDSLYQGRPVSLVQ